MESKAQRFREMHHGPPILVLPNAWDAGSARVFEQAGFPAIGTTSAGIAFSHGLPDGQRLTRAQMLEAVKRIAGAVSVPVTADMEAGYGETPEELAETARGVVAAGAVGLNLEDSRPDKQLYDVALQMEKIRAIREAGDLVINARTDVFALGIGDLTEAVRRLNAYYEAGADCLFAPGLRDTATIGRVVRGVHGPVNILAVAGVPSVSGLERMGVARVSLGSGPMRACLGLTMRVARELLDSGTYLSFLDGAVPYADMNRMFSASQAQVRFAK